MATPKLLLVPNRYKSGVLYSQLPESGAGDFDVVRATTATRVNASGLLESVAANVPRLDFGVSGCPVLLVEASGTNLLLQSNNFSNAAWQKDAGLNLTSGQVSPTVAGNEGWEVNDNSASLLGLRQTATISTPQKTGSVRIKKTIGAPAIYPLFDILFLTGGVANTDTYFLFNTSTGAFHQVAIGTPALNPFLRATSLNEDWWEVEWGAEDPTGTQTQCQLDLYPAGSFNGTTINSAATGSQFIFGFQLENGLEDTSYIPTTTAAATRNADVMTVEPPAGTTSIVATFEDGSNEEVSPSGTYTIPNGRIKSIVMT
jgi:hypothetical protein